MQSLLSQSNRQPSTRADRLIAVHVAVERAIQLREEEDRAVAQETAVAQVRAVMRHPDAARVLAVARKLAAAQELASRVVQAEGTRTRAAMT